MTPATTLRRSRRVASALTIGLAALACVVAWRAGGDVAAPRPRPDGVRPATLAGDAAAACGPGSVDACGPGSVDACAPGSVDACGPAGVGEAFEVSARLVEIAGADRALVAVSDVGASGAGERGVDRREALASPASGAIALRVNVPRGARLDFAEAVADVTDEATAFVVEVVDALGARHAVYRHVVAPGAARRWSDATCDLSAFAGQEVELRLSTEVAPTPGRAAPGARTRGTSGARGRVAARPPVGLWGTPTLYAKTTPRVPYNVLWIVVDALRPDVFAGARGDAAEPPPKAPAAPALSNEAATKAPAEPALVELARRGALFPRAYSAGAWARTAAIAMLAGARASELGVGGTDAALGPAEAARLHGSGSPLLPFALRRQRVTTRASGSEARGVGDGLAGLDLGFERVDRRRDARATTEEAARWILDHRGTRFFALVSYAAPRAPPASRPGGEAPAGPKDAAPRLHAAEADDAVGALVRVLDEAGLRERTVVVVSAHHGEAAPARGAGALGSAPPSRHDVRARSSFEETTRAPLVIVAPGAVAPGTEVRARVRSTDVAPTVLDLLGVEPHARMSGTSLLALARGQREREERVVVSEGRGARAILHGRWRLVVRDGGAGAAAGRGVATSPASELFDVEEDPGERRDLASRHPEIVAEMKARLVAALENVPVAGAAAAGPSSAAERPPVLRLRFSGGASSRRVSGTIAIGDGTTKPKSVDVLPVELGRDAFRVEEGKVDVALRTSPSAPVGFDLVIDPPSAPVGWELWLDDEPWPVDAVFGGPFGLPAPILRSGVTTDEARFIARAPSPPTIDPRRDVGVFVTRERHVERAPAGGGDDADAQAMARALRALSLARVGGTIPR
ncbi:MAG: sulfatase-like hydrolase/transferase [Labilithrix sp.]|nr:sulfatase-like hydrolase/transferase [Labilithrix sp.]